MRLIQAVYPLKKHKKILAEAEKVKGIDFQHANRLEGGKIQATFAAAPGGRQALLDKLQILLGKNGDWHIYVYRPDVVLPVAESGEEPAASSTQTVSREELYSTVEKGASGSTNDLFLTALSAVVAAIGLMEDNVAVVIGAMIISPLLGPGLAFTLGASLGDTPLMFRAVRATVLMFACVFIFSFFLGVTMDFPTDSSELIARTSVGFSGVALALASGAAAALSLTTGLSATLVGVMIAVALLPPAVVMALMAAQELWGYAFGAAMLLAINLVSVNLAAQVVFWLKGVRPRTWYKKKAARQSTYVTFGVWLFLLGIFSTILLLA